jgi:hypothetical protein
MMNNTNNTNNNTHSLQLPPPTNQKKKSRLSNILKIATINAQHLTQIKTNDIINLMKKKIFKLWVFQKLDCLTNKLNNFYYMKKITLLSSK